MSGAEISLHAKLSMHRVLDETFPIKSEAFLTDFPQGAELNKHRRYHQSHERSEPLPECAPHSFIFLNFPADSYNLVSQVLEHSKRIQQDKDRTTLLLLSVTSLLLVVLKIFWRQRDILGQFPAANTRCES